MTENEIKEELHKHVCPHCLEEMRKKHPNMLDCIFRHNDDEHLCKYGQLLAQGHIVRFIKWTEK